MDRPLLCLLLHPVSIEILFSFGPADRQMAGGSYYLGKKHEGVVLKQNACTCVSVYRVLCGFLGWWKSVNVSMTGE